jgi:hypothetical protein
MLRTALPTVPTIGSLLRVAHHRAGRLRPDRGSNQCTRAILASSRVSHLYGLDVRFAPSLLRSLGTYCDPRALGSASRAGPASRWTSLTRQSACSASSGVDWPNPSRPRVLPARTNGQSSGATTVSATSSRCFVRLRRTSRSTASAGGFSRLPTRCSRRGEPSGWTYPVPPKLAIRPR